MQKWSSFRTPLVAIILSSQFQQCQNITFTYYHFLKVSFSACTFGATQSHNQRAVALVELPEAGAASSVSDDRQLPQDESLVTGKHKIKKKQTKKTFCLLMPSISAAHGQAWTVLCQMLVLGWIMCSAFHTHYKERFYLMIVIKCQAPDIKNMQRSAKSSEGCLT